MFFIKPVAWSQTGYARPGGGRFVTGYPHDHGFGHEEWNHSDRFLFQDGGDDFRVFHTEALGKQDAESLHGRIVLFLIAEHGGVQHLVTVAAGCSALHSDRHRSRRLALVKSLGLDGLWPDAWAEPQVRRAFDNDEGAFRAHWRRELHWMPTWIAPDSLFLPLAIPVALNPLQLSGKKFLARRYGGYQNCDQDLASKILASIPSSEDHERVQAILDFCAADDTSVHDDVADAVTARTSPTERLALYQARIGHGAYRENLKRIWGGRCAVTGCDVSQLLRASHIKAWKRSNNTERLDPKNGLLLAAHLDCLFDRGLISFDHDGGMLVCRELEGRTDIWGLGAALRAPVAPETMSYLKAHRELHFPSWSRPSQQAESRTHRTA